MNKDEQYSVNRGNTEHPAWENAHWLRASDLAGFHVMSLDSNGSTVLKHSSAIRSLKVDTFALEAEMARLLTSKELTTDARKLLEAALEAQNTGRRPALEWSV